MKIRHSLLLGVLVGMETVACAQEVKIAAFGTNGLLSWQAPSNSDCTVEWASSLSPTAQWSRTWVDLINLHSTNGEGSARVPMFYRISAWTNGLFVRMPLKRTLVYAVSNAVGETWNEEISAVGMLTIPWATQEYIVFTATQVYTGSPPLGVVDDEVLFGRATDQALYGFGGREPEEVVWQSGPIGTAWTNGARITAIETNEDVTVPVGTFTGCVKFKTTDTSILRPSNTWDEWVKPGFFMVKWIDYAAADTNAIPVVYELESWRDE